MLASSSALPDSFTHWAKSAQCTISRAVSTAAGSVVAMSVHRGNSCVADEPKTLQPCASTVRWIYASADRLTDLTLSVV